MLQRDGMAIGMNARCGVAGGCAALPAAYRVPRKQRRTA